MDKTPQKNINSGVDIYYTTDGSTPSANANKYAGPFSLPKGEVKAIAIARNESGSVASRQFGIISNDWKLISADSETGNHNGSLAFDGNPKTYWRTESTGSAHNITIDLGKSYNLAAFAYTPQTATHGKGMMEKGIIKVSTDGNTWTESGTFQFGNLVNDPTTRKHAFNTPVTARYVRIESTVIAGDDNALAIAELEFFE